MTDVEKEFERNVRIALMQRAIDDFKKMKNRNLYSFADENCEEEFKVLEELVRMVLSYAIDIGLSDIWWRLCEEIFLEKRIMNRILHCEDESCEFYNSLSDEDKTRFIDFVKHNYSGTGTIFDFDDEEVVDWCVCQAMRDMKENK